MSQEIDKTKEEIHNLVLMTEEHDCHLSPEDSCDCVGWKKEILSLEDKLYKLTIKKHGTK